MHAREPGWRWLRQAIEAFSRHLQFLAEKSLISGAEVRELAARGLEMGADRIRLRGSYIGVDLLGSGSMLLISVERAAEEPISDEVLRERFRLTRK